MDATQITYRAPDGTFWDFTRPNHEVAILAGTVEGFSPTLQPSTVITPTLPGQTIDNFYIPPATGNLTLTIATTNKQRFQTLISRLRRNFSQITPGTLNIRAGRLGTLSTKVRLAEPIVPPRVDPRDECEEVELTLRLVSDSGLWDAVPQRIEETTMTDVFNVGDVMMYPEVMWDRSANVTLPSGWNVTLPSVSEMHRLWMSPESGMVPIRVSDGWRDYGLARQLQPVYEGVPPGRDRRFMVTGGSLLFSARFLDPWR